jgi:iron complex outermembrane receptor protein
MSYKSLLMAGVVGAGLTFAAASANAQAPVAAGAAAADAAALETIVVTGTRLTAAGFTAPTPVTVLGQDSLQKRAPANMAEAINELPAFRLSAGPTNVPRQVIGSGQQSPDLRGLGSSRTLVLVDGRRYVGSQLNGTADISTLPTSLVERVEVVTGGASAAYGSDAVAGVVNFILNDRLVGVKGGAHYGSSEFDDAVEHNINLAAGFAFAGGRGHFIIGGDLVKAKGAGTFYSRPRYESEPGLIASGTVRPAGVPAQQWLASGVELIYPPGGIITAGPLRGTAFNADGSVFQMQLTNVFGQNMVGNTQNYGRNSVLHMRLYQPFYRNNALARVNFDITPDVTVFGEFNYAYNDNKGGTGDTYLTPGLIVGRDNPFIPASVRAQMTALNLQTITVGRYNNDITPYRVNSEWNLRRGVIGARGRFLDNWQWEASYVKGQNIQDFNIHFPDRVNIQASAYVITGPDGRPMCGPPASNPNLPAADIPNVSPNCVPFNLFGQTNSQAALDYVGHPATAHNVIKIDVGGITVNGSLFSMPAGEVAVAFGGELRKESVNASADPRSRVGAFVTGNQATYTGERTVKEGFAEMAVPLLRDVPMALELGLNGAIRRTDYSTSGAVTTWKAGVTYRPTDFLRFRATKSRDIRAPALSELFLTRSTGGVSNILNPFTGQVGRISSISGGNPNLRPEIADSFTAGVVFQPRWGITNGLQISVDYYDIKIAKVIASIDSAAIILRCHRGETALCSNIVFDNTQFGIFSVAAVPQNLNQLQARGVDLELLYRVPMDSLPVDIPGQIELRSLTTFVDRLTTTDANGPVNYAGYSVGGVADVSGNVSVTYDVNRFSGMLQARYFDDIRWDPFLVGPDNPSYNPAAANSINKNLFPGLVTLNASLSYDLIRRNGDRFQVFLTVNNLLDRKPPLIGAAAFNQNGTQLYDLIGRYYRAGFRFNF